MFFRVFMIDVYKENNKVYGPSLKRLVLQIASPKFYLADSIKDFLDNKDKIKPKLNFFCNGCSMVAFTNVDYIREDPPQHLLPDCVVKILPIHTLSDLTGSLEFQFHYQYSTTIKNSKKLDNINNGRLYSAFILYHHVSGDNYILDAKILGPKSPELKKLSLRDFIPAFAR